MDDGGSEPETDAVTLPERSVDRAAGEALTDTGTEGPADPTDSVDSVDSADERTAAVGEIPIEFPERDPGELDDATELLLMDQHAAGDDTVTVQLLGWRRDGDVVLVDYALPTGERQHDRYRWPTPGRYDDSDFLALVRGLGYTPASADHVAGEFARARSENGQWRIVTGRRTDADGQGTDPGDTDAGTAAGWTADHLPAGVERWLVRRDPMDVASAGVFALFCAVTLPAVLAVIGVGSGTLLTALGSGLFLVGVVGLWLGLAAAEL